VTIQIEGRELEPEKPRDYFRDAFRWSAEYSKLRQYFNTRSSVLEGASLQDYSPTDLRAANFMGPLTFNVYETALAALPTQAVVAIIWFFSAAPVDAPQLFGDLPDSVFSRSLRVLLPNFLRLVTPLVVPSTALALAWVASLLSLYRSDWTRAKLRRARDAFLYYDGAHGLIPELSMAVLFTVAPLLSEGLLQLLFTGLGAVAYFAARKTEDQLAATNDYRTGPYATVVGFRHDEPLPEFPSRRYRLGLAVLVWPITYGIALALNLAAFALAALMSWCRALVLS